MRPLLVPVSLVLIALFILVLSVEFGVVVECPMAGMCG